jgi:uncharacterized glyoxalase superfamily protein PhnB
MADPVFRSVTPLIPAGTSLSRALTFYKDQLGFSVLWEDEDMAGIRRGSVSFNLVANTNKEWADNCSCSIGVSDLEALYEEYRSRGVLVGPVKLRPWGRREFHMIVPSGVCLQFYEQAD